MSNEEKLNVFINKFWNPVQETLDNLTTKTPDEVKAWFGTETYVAAYTQVYMCCVAPVIVPPPSESDGRAEFFHGKLIYERLTMYMTRRFQEVSSNIESKKTSEEAFSSYMHAQLAFETYRKMIEKTFHYIQRHWIDLVSKSSFSYRRDILSIEKLLISLWLQLVVQPNLPIILNGAKIELTKTRQFKLQDNQVADFIGFISSYSQDQELPQCGTLNQSLAQFYEEDLKTFLVTFASTNSLASELDVSRCELIISTWNEEMDRVKASFGKVKDLVKKYKKILRECLIEPSSSSIEGILADLLRSPHINQALISGLYKIYSAYKILHQRAVQLFEHVFTERVTLKSDNLMTHILECTIWADSLLNDCFENSEDYVAARDKVLRTVFSGNAGSSSSSMLAARIDEVIRTPNVLADNSSEQRQLVALMTLFRFVEDKETFRANYTHFLALRLMTWRQQATDVLSERMKLEKQMIEHLEKTCGSGFVGLLNRILADVENEEENAKGLLPADMSSTVQVMILTGGSWPQAKSGWDERIWPEQVRNVYGAAAKNYAKKYSSRKLEWFPELSTVAIKMGNSLVTLSILQYSFLFHLLQNGSRALKAECLAYYDLTEEAFGSLIYGLMACGLIHTNVNMYFINEAAVDKFPPRLDLAFVVRNSTSQQIQASYSDIGARNQPVDYDTLIQCYLVHISKKEGKEGRLLRSLLFERTKDALSSRINLADTQLEAQLKILIEKEYIEIDSEGKYVKYCP